MKTKVDPKVAPERIWLLLHEGEGGSHVWCDQPCPNPTGTEQPDAVEYIRLDLAAALVQELVRCLS